MTTRSSIRAERYRERLSAAQAGAARAGLAAILVGVGPDLRYLTGYPAMPLERLTMLVIPAVGDLALVVPRLEATPARSCPAAAAGDLPVVTWEEGDDAYALVAGMVRDAVAVAGGVAAGVAGVAGEVPGGVAGAAGVAGGAAGSLAGEVPGGVAGAAGVAGGAAGVPLSAAGSMASAAGGVAAEAADSAGGPAQPAVSEAGATGDIGLRVAVSDDLAARHLLRLQDRLAPVRLELASATLRELRIVKDPDEVAMLRMAAHAADRVVAAIAAGRLVGRTEADVAREVRERLVAEGHDEAHFAIVGSGPNSASPHHGASERVIQAGEPIVLDIGGTIDGYGSDITRTLWVTGGDPAAGPDERFRHLFGVLYGAQAAAARAVRPGVAPEDVDGAARRPIEAEGYGEAFFHRTGHGIGLEGHEDPYIIAGNREPLREGMAFSVEPGIYLVGEYGARIEDIVVCGPDGPIALNQAPRELYVVDG